LGVNATYFFSFSSLTREEKKGESFGGFKVMNGSREFGVKL